jgi:hypothetical protein
MNIFLCRTYTICITEDRDLELHKLPEHHEHREFHQHPEHPRLRHLCKIVNFHPISLSGLSSLQEGVIVTILTVTPSVTPRNTTSMHSAFRLHITLTHSRHGDHYKHAESDVTITHFSQPHILNSLPRHNHAFRVRM